MDKVKSLFGLNDASTIIPSTIKPSTIKPSITIDNESNDAYMSKIIVVGDIGSGKTSFIKRSVQGIFTEYYKATIGVDFALKNMKSNDDVSHQFQLWDIAGKEIFGNQTPFSYKGEMSLYKGAMGAFVVCDITRLSTIQGAIKWKYDIDGKASLPNGEPIIYILLVSKMDLDNEDSLKNYDFDKFCEEHGFVAWFPISSKNNTNLTEAMTTMKICIEKLYAKDDPVDNNNESCTESCTESCSETNSEPNDIATTFDFDKAITTFKKFLFESETSELEPNERKDDNNDFNPDNELEMDLIRECCFLSTSRGDMIQLFIDSDFNPSEKDIKMQLAKMSTNYYFVVPDKFQTGSFLKIQIASKKTDTSKHDTLMAMVKKSIDDYKMLMSKVKEMLEQPYDVDAIYNMLIVLPIFLLYEF